MLRFSAIALLVLASQATAALVDPVPPRFPDQYSAHVDLSQLGPSGRVEKTQACDFAWDLKANATSYRNCGWKGTQMQEVYLYDDNRNGNAGTVYYVFGHGPGGDTCNFWCDLQGSQQCSGGDSLCQFDYLKSAKFNGTGTVNGTYVNTFIWNDMLGPISMNSLELDVAVSGGAPVRMLRNVHPFGKEIGYLDTTYSLFVKEVPSGAFSVPGKEDCSEGEDAQCENALKGEHSWLH